eukprot:TRINITY_DN5194_c0_g1_i1.p1 TRINITY_DN5194_c0_g1~~TRINITY_DN5194_c0_g1_i1.p1  ORF type:complete len:384 (-),score=58.75 TRINITY_DN5194_c0_g1_i1:7-1158(-)
MASKLLSFGFEVTHVSKKSKARTGVIHTPHGSFETPDFVPVATNGVLKAVGFDQVNDINKGLVFCNTYHLMIHPGTDVIAKAGGIHKYVGYDGPMITDSGGFQIFSLNQDENEIQNELKGKVNKGYQPLLSKLTEEGVIFSNYRNGDKLFLSPETSVRAQKDIGADIIIPLDQLLPHNVSEEELLSALERTHRWEERSLNEHLKNRNGQAMYAVAHGGIDYNLRKKSIEHLMGLEFDGLAIGGSLGSTHHEMSTMLSQISPLLPDDKPIHLLGIGDPEGISDSVQFGIDTFDSIYPIRIGRHGTILTKNGKVNMGKLMYKDMVDSPLVEGCTCSTCQTTSKSLYHHLLKQREPLAGTLGSIHNLHFIKEQFKEIRYKIRNDLI